MEGISHPSVLLSSVEGLSMREAEDWTCRGLIAQEVCQREVDPGLPDRQDNSPKPNLGW